MSKSEKVKYEEKYGSFSSIGYFPLKDQVWLLPLRIEPVERPNLILPPNVKNEHLTFNKYPYQGVVVAVGPGFNKENPTVLRPGMRVYLNMPFHDPSTGEIPMGRVGLWKGINYYKCQEGNINGIADSDDDDPRLEEGYNDFAPKSDIDKKKVN